MRYGTLGGGKRIRPCLTLSMTEACGADPMEAVQAALAVEFVHCFSLIHDDLPALDDDDLRRGRPTCHRAFGEATAILAGDALYGLAFETLATSTYPPDVIVALILELTQATGSDGLVGGESLDLLGEGQAPNLDLVQRIHERKTGALFAAAAAMGAIVAGSDQIHQARAFGRRLGLAFQIADDLLNETSTAETLGKAAGSDRARGKQTYPAVLGVEETRRLASETAQSALHELAGLPGPVDLLQAFVGLSVDRLA